MATWYVRPDTSHSGTRNGTSYATAWGGWSEITWGVGGVVGGDTLYVCGAHSYSATITIGNHGGSSEGTRCTIRGDHSDPGSTSFVPGGARFLANPRAWTTVTKLTINAGSSNCIFLSDTATNCVYSENEFNGGTSASAMISFSGSTGDDHSDVTIRGNSFVNGVGASGEGMCIRWFPSAAGATSTLTRLTISGNTFTNCGTLARGVIMLRAESDTTDCALRDLVIEDNVIESCAGYCIEASNETASFGTNTGVRITGNRFLNCFANPDGIGGCISVLGFAGSSTAGFGLNLVQNNIAKNVQGAAGFCNAFYGTYIVRWNEVDGLTTGTVDGNALLFDHGANACIANGNTFRNIYGKSGVANSGVGIMVLDATNIVVSGNTVNGCKWGIHLGAPGSGQSCTISNNTITGCTDGAIFTTSTADLANCTVKNNVFVGDGYSVFDQTAVSWSLEDYNDFYGFATGASNHALGTHSITSNPLIDASYLPIAGSPCIDAGALIDGVVLKDFYGKDITASPDIGAVQRYAARAASASRSAITRSTITRSVHDRRAVCG